MSLYTLNTLYTLYMINNEDIDIDITTDISTCVIQYYILLVKFAILLFIISIIIFIISCKLIYNKHNKHNKHT